MDEPYELRQLSSTDRGVYVKFRQSYSIHAIFKKNIYL